MYQVQHLTMQQMLNCSSPVSGSAGLEEVVGVGGVVIGGVGVGGLVFIVGGVFGGVVGGITVLLSCYLLATEPSILCKSSVS